MGSFTFWRVKEYASCVLLCIIKGDENRLGDWACDPDKKNLPATRKYDLPWIGGDSFMATHSRIHTQGNINTQRQASIPG